MAGSLSISTHAEPRNKATVTASGLAAATAHNLVITEADGSTTTRPITTDGSGAFTFVWVPQGPGTVTYRVDAVPVNAVATTSGSKRGN